MIFLNKPIYQVGYAHGGLTTLSFMLKQNPELYTVSGLHGFGSDEGHNVFYHTEIPIPLKNPDGYREGAWQYGLDENITQYHLIETDYQEGQREQYLQVLAGVRKKWKVSDNKRFLDKSQPYLTKTRFLQELLKPSDVYFIYVIRNPYVLCYKPLKYLHWYPDAKNDYERVSLGINNVMNTYFCFMMDKPYLKHSKIVRYEDIILDTINTLWDICKFLGLNLTKGMLPLPGYNPIYAHPKFYPLRPECVTEGRSQSDKFDALITKECQEIIERFNYSIPRKL